MIIIAMAFAMAAQDVTTCERQGGKVVCTTRSAPAIDGYAGALGPPPTYSPTPMPRPRSQKQVDERQQFLAMAPGFSHDQCRKAVNYATSIDDLELARDLLAACLR